METTHEPRTHKPSRQALAQPADTSADAAGSCLEGVFVPDPDTLASFLVNALYLFGDQRIAAYGDLPEGVTAELIRLGHPVSVGRVHRTPNAGRGVATGTLASGRSGGALPRPVREGGSDRAVFLDGALGRGDDDRILETLKAMRRTVRPGGLLCFHVFDRDRAWGQVGEREAGLARIRVGFSPETGRLAARVLGPIDAIGKHARREASGTASGYASIKTWNLSEIPALLRAAGLVLERVYGDWNGGSPEAGGAETGRLIVVAARPRTAKRPRVANQPRAGRPSIQRSGPLLIG